MMKQYFRYLTFLVLTFWGVQAFAFDDVDRFVKRCDILTSSDSHKEQIANLKKEKKLLKNAAVPIRLSFSDCERVKHIIKLKNGLETSVDSYYSSKSNDDYRNTRSSWIQYSPSPKYWLFSNEGFGDNWVLINKSDGQLIHPNSECSANNLVMNANFIAVICQDGSYQNREPTIYVAKLNEISGIAWSKPIKIQACDTEAARSYFTSDKLEFVNASTLRIVGTCHLSRKNIVEKTVKVNYTIIFDESGLTVKSKSNVINVDWD